MRIVFASEHFFESCQARSHRNRIGVVRTTVKHLVLRDEIHHRLVCTEGRQGQPTADGFRQADHVGLNPEILCGSAPTKFRAGLYFVVDQQRSVLCRDIAQRFQEARLRQAQADIHENRFENDRGDLADILLEAKLNASEIVERRYGHVSNRRLRDTEPTRDRVGGIDIAEFRCMRLDADQCGIVQSVISTFKLHDLVASGRGAGQANSVHGSFRATVAKTKHLDRKTLTDFFGQLPLHVVRHAEHGASRKTLFDCFHHGRMAMPGHESPEAQVVIDVFVSIEIAKPAALCVLHKDRIGIVSAIVARDPEWYTFEIALVRLSRLRRAALENIELVF